AGILETHVATTSPWARNRTTVPHHAALSPRTSIFEVYGVTWLASCRELRAALLTRAKFASAHPAGTTSTGLEPSIRQKRQHRRCSPITADGSIRWNSTTASITCRRRPPSNP